ncbi:MAG: DUF6115 domain-containing protein [Bacteroidota bacterium]
MDNLVLSQVPWDILAAVVVIVAGILFIVFSVGMMLGERRAQAVPNGREGHKRERGKRASDPGAGDAVSDATRAIEAAAARAIQDLEAKAGAAARLLDEAEARIVRLREVLGALERETEQHEGPGPAPGPQVVDAPLQPEVRQLDADVAGVTTSAEAASVQVEATCAEAEGGGQAATRVPGVSEKHALVFRLADQGLTVPEIARRVGIGRGEVQLILDLHGKDCRTNPSEPPAGA